MNNIEVTLLTSEYPPNFYGGVGVLVNHLTAELSKTIKVEVRAFGDMAINESLLKVTGYGTLQREMAKFEVDNNGLKTILGTLSLGLSISKSPARLVHNVTWYTAFSAFLMKTFYNIPLITMPPSLEPLRPWKELQLGNGYKVSSFVEKLALENSDRIVAVSTQMKDDIKFCYPQINEDKIKIIPLGIDTNYYKPTVSKNALQKYGIKSDYILFVGRMSEQKGIQYLLEATKNLPKDIQTVFCCGQADTKDLGEELKTKAELLNRSNKNIVWIEKSFNDNRSDLIELYSNAIAFICPSLYETFGLVNLEAMACETPVIGSDIGGLKDVLLDKKTGFLVKPGNVSDLTDKINLLVSQRQLAKELGIACRKRVKEHFTWEKIAKQYIEIYRELLEPENYYKNKF